MKVTDPKYSFNIVGKQFHNRGEIFRIDIDGSIRGCTPMAVAAQ